MLEFFARNQVSKEQTRALMADVTARFREEAAVIVIRIRIRINNQY
jgi:hypothetical protein